MKRVLILAVMVFALTCAWASVAINEQNFPEPQIMEWAKYYDEDGNDVLSDAEIENATSIQLYPIHSLRGLEHFKNLQNFNLWYYDFENEEDAREDGSFDITSYDFSIFPNLADINLQRCLGFTSLDFSKNKKLTHFQLEGCKNITSFKLPDSIENINLLELPKVKNYDFKQLNELMSLRLIDVAISDVDCSNLTKLRDVTILSLREQPYELNSLDLSGCTDLEILFIEGSTIKKVNLKDLPVLGTIQITESELTDLNIENCGVRWVTVYDNHINNLTIKNCPEMEQSLDCSNNELKVLLLDNLPKLPNVNCSDNQLLFLDLSGMQKGFEEAEGFFNGDDQHPSMVAYKISPTEVGLRVHSRFDVSRVLNLKVKGKAQTPRETTVDGVRYFVFYDNGPDVASLVGTQSNYEYETRWPYPWVNGNSKDNNLPVSLNIYKWTKPSSWIKIDGETSITSEVGKSLAAPSVQRSQDYDGQLTWKSSNEDVVKVNPTTGAMSFVGIGTATVTVTGAETDYRLSPSAVTITIVVTEPTGISGNVRTGKPDNVRTHDLLGRRIDRQSATKGVVVVNGRKVVKK